MTVGAKGSPRIYAKSLFVLLPQMYEAQLERIKAKLETYAVSREGRQKWIFECPLIYNLTATSNQIEEFETQYGVVLPADYKAFISTIADGHIGPGMGIASLFAEPCDWRREMHFYEFPFACIDDEWEVIAIKTPERAKQLSAIALHLTCTDIGEEWCLVIRGEEYGNVWRLPEGEMPGRPLKSGASERVSFLDWYESWLNGVSA